MDIWLDFFVLDKNIWTISNTCWTNFLWAHEMKQCASHYIWSQLAMVQ